MSFHFMKWLKVQATIRTAAGLFLICFSLFLPGQLQQAWASPDLADGPEFLVNTTTDGAQGLPSVAALADGGYVVVWYDSSAPGLANHIRAQIYNSDHTARGTEIAVESTDGSHTQPSVASLASGGFIVAWSENGEVNARRFDADGQHQSFQFRVNTTTELTQDQPSVAGLSDGGYVIAWRDASQLNGDASGNSVRAMVFNADDGLRRGEFLVNTTTDSVRGNPALAG